MHTLVVLYGPVMGAGLLKLVVLGEIPGTDIRLDYYQSIIAALIVCILIVFNFALIYENRRFIKRKIAQLYNDIESITI